VAIVQPKRYDSDSDNMLYLSRQRHLCMSTADESAEGRVGATETSGQFWHQNDWGFRMVVFYTLLSLVGIASVSQPVVTLVAGEELASAIGIPVYIFGFALLGALTYVFTSVLSNYNSDLKKVFEAGLRIPAALLLAAGVYLLTSLVFPGASAVGSGSGAAIGKETLAAGLAFLVGLYVKLTLKALGGVADSLYRGIGRDRSQ
jgi:hypothetical protein